MEILQLLNQASKYLKDKNILLPLNMLNAAP